MHLRLPSKDAHRARREASVLRAASVQTASVGGAGRGRPPEAAARRAGLEFVEKLLTADVKRWGREVRPCVEEIGANPTATRWPFRFPVSAVVVMDSSAHLPK
jgi:hypothetical protein